LWAAAQDLEMPINLHILTGYNYSNTFTRQQPATGPSRSEGPRNAVNAKTFDAVNALYELIWCGILARYPRLKFAIVENEVGWIPFFLQQWDYYFRRFRAKNAFLIDSLPSEYFHRQVYATFFDDSVGGHSFQWWGVDNCMWSNDYPHPNSTWPNSREVIARDLGHLPEEDRRKLVCGNVAQLYGLKVSALA
jgi:predicted TIM-barrel fold metal-dependent hydrolase